jgi:D-alanyl-D-alanine carboxypeptidase
MYVSNFKFASWIALALAVCVTVSARAADALSSATETKIDAIANGWVHSGRSAGLAVAVARGGQMMFVRGYGYANLEDKVPVTPDTVFRIASITKQFTAAAVARLAEQGKLSLEDRVAKYFPGLPNGNAVSIRQLLNHTAGIHNMVEDLFADPRQFQQLRLEYSEEELLAKLQTHQSLYDFPPGTGWHYSNTGYMLAGMIVEKVCAKALDPCLREQIFDKLGMAHSAVDDNETLVAHRAVGYDAIQNQPGDFQRTQFFSMSGAKWSGGMRSTVGDLVRWHHALLAGQVLAPGMLEQMLSPARLLDGRPARQGQVPANQATESMAAGDYGLGLNFSKLDGHRQIGHDGNVFGFNAVLYSYPDDGLTLVVLSNTSGGLEGEGGPVWKQIAQTVLAASK